MTNKLRIIGGQWRSRNIVFADAPGLRPTPSRVRETLFNWLQADLADSRCLDLYSGSGALGFEAASRGAKQVLQLESNPQTCINLKENILALSATQVHVLQLDVLQFLASPPTQFDLVFLDPPFGQNLVSPTAQLLNDHDWLADFAKIYIETERNNTLEGLPSNWQRLKDKTAGDVSFYLYQKI